MSRERGSCGRGFGVAAMVLTLAACPAAHETVLPDPYLRGAIDAAHWLQSLATGENGGGIPTAWSDSTRSASLGTGSAGHALFFAELYAATGDSSYRRSARDAATAALSAPRGAPGLYNGEAGVASVVSVVGRVIDDATLRGLARLRFDTLAGDFSSRSGPDAQGSIGRRVGEGWGPVNDVLTGLGGVGLSLFHAFEEYGDSAHLRAGIAIADTLLTRARPAPGGGLRWMRGEDGELDLPNFSHGTAGIGYVMARAASYSSDSRFARAADAAAAYLEAVADTVGGLFLVPYGVPNDGYATAYDIGWAHGPAGVARLHYLLGAQGRVHASARTIVASGAPGPSSDTTRWSDVDAIDQRFGTAGAATFLIDWGIANDRADWRAAGLRLADDILERSVVSEPGISWSIPKYGFQGGEGEGVYTGYFYGAAGYGVALLRAHYALIGEPPRVRLPDDPFPTYRDG